MQISQLLVFCRRCRIGKVIQGNPIGSVSDTIDYKPYNLEAMFTSIIVLYVYLLPASQSLDKVLLESSKNPYTFMIFDVFGTLFILIVLL